MSRDLSHACCCSLQASSTQGNSSIYLSKLNLFFFLYKVNWTPSTFLKYYTQITILHHLSLNNKKKKVKQSLCYLIFKLKKKNKRLTVLQAL